MSKSNALNLEKQFDKLFQKYFNYSTRFSIARENLGVYENGVEWARKLKYEAETESEKERYEKQLKHFYEMIAVEEDNEKKYNEFTTNSEKELKDFCKGLARTVEKVNHLIKEL